MANEVMTIEKQANTIASKATQWLMSDIKDGKIKPLSGYDLGAEIGTAMLKIAQTNDRNGKPALQACTQESIISAMRDMALQGLSMGRNQCYPIVYGNKLQIQRSYFGTVAVFNRMFPNLKVTANVLYKGDDYEYCVDEIYDFTYVTNVRSKIENRDNPIVAAYGSIIDMTTKERVYACVMSQREIEKSWSKAKTKNVQQDFPQEMAKRTLINRMCKLYVNTCTTVDPSFLDAYTRTTENEYDEERPATPTEVDKAKAIRGKSKGLEGLKNLVKREKAEDVKSTPVENTPSEPNSEPQSDSVAKVEEYTDQYESNDSSEDYYDQETGEVFELTNEEIPF